MSCIINQFLADIFNWFSVLIGEEFSGSGKALVITYHRHYFGLGEHYNSTKPEQKDDEEDN